MTAFKYTIYAILILINILYTLDEKLPYPVFILKLYSDNFYRFLLYSIFFLFLKYDFIASILFMILIISVHIDYINYIHIPKNQWSIKTSFYIFIFLFIKLINKKLRCYKNN